MATPESHQLAKLKLENPVAVGEKIEDREMVVVGKGKEKVLEGTKGGGVHPLFFINKPGYDSQIRIPKIEGHKDELVFDENDDDETDPRRNERLEFFFEKCFVTYQQDVYLPSLFKFSGYDMHRYRTSLRDRADRARESGVFRLLPYVVREAMSFYNWEHNASYDLLEVKNHSLKDIKGGSLCKLSFKAMNLSDYGDVSSFRAKAFIKKKVQVKIRYCKRICKSAKNQGGLSESL